jgi:transposase
VIALAPGTKVYLACKPVDMRNGFDGLTALAKRIFDADPFTGHLFLFRAKRADYLKALHWDGTGLCLFAKRLEQGKFVWPPLIDSAQVLTPAQLAVLIEGMDWRRTIAPLQPRLPQQVLSARYS